MDRKENQFVKRFCQHLPHLKKDEKKRWCYHPNFTSRPKHLIINHSFSCCKWKTPTFSHLFPSSQTKTNHHHHPWPVRLAYHSNPNISALDESALRVAWHRIQLQKHLEHLEAKNWCFGSMFLLSIRLAFFMWTSGFFLGLLYISKKWSTSSRLTGGYKDDIRRSRQKIKPRNLASLTTSGFFSCFCWCLQGFLKGHNERSFQVVSVSDLDTLSPYKDQHHSIPPSSWPPPLQFHDHGMGGRMMLMISRSCVLNVGIPSFPWKDLCVCVVWFSGNCSREVSMLKLSSWKALLERYRKKEKLEKKSVVSHILPLKRCTKLTKIPFVLENLKAVCCLLCGPKRLCGASPSCSQ